MIAFFWAGIAATWLLVVLVGFGIAPRQPSVNEPLAAAWLMWVAGSLFLIVCRAAAPRATSPQSDPAKTRKGDTLLALSSALLFAHALTRTLSAAWLRLGFGSASGWQAHLLTLVDAAVLAALITGLVAGGVSARR